MVTKIDTAICTLAVSIAEDCIAPEYRAETVKTLAESVQARTAMESVKMMKDEGHM